MKPRAYYSIRTGRRRDGFGYDLQTLQRLLLDLYRSLYRDGYCQEYFGIDCTDGFIPGLLGHEVDAKVHVLLKKFDMWPIEEYALAYSEEDCFDMIEFLHDHISEPDLESGSYHSWNDCGIHYSEFDREAGRKTYRAQVSAVLHDYSSGWELGENGEILARADDGMESLLEADLPEYDPENVEDRVSAAILKYRRRGASMDDRRDAVRDLADVLEFLRPKANEYLIARKDEKALYGIVNEFGVRHHSRNQKTDYSKGIWYSWMFYFNLATIHASVRAIKEGEAKERDGANNETAV